MYQIIEDDMRMDEALQWAYDTLGKSEGALRDNEVLLGFVTRQDAASLKAHPERTLSDHQEIEFRDLVHRRGLHEPIAYLVGEKEFYGLTFKVDRRVLIPRPETELLVDCSLEQIKRINASVVADIGTGSGCIAVALAKHEPRIKVFGIDSSPDALKVAKLNVNAHFLNTQITLTNASLSQLPFGPQVVVANLPYLTTKQMEELSPDIRDYEPHGALDGGPDGFDHYRTLFTECQGLLSIRAILIEIDPAQAKLALTEAQNAFSDASLQIHPDLQGLERVLVITR